MYLWIRGDEDVLCQVRCKAIRCPDTGQCIKCKTNKKKEKKNEADV